MGRRTIMAEWSSGSLPGSCPGGRWFKSYPLQSRRWRKCPYKSRRCADYMSEVAQLVEHERKMDHVCDPNSNLSFHAKDVVGGSSPSLTLYGDVVQREHSSSVKKNVMLVA